MFSVYLICLILGGIFIGVSTFAGAETDVDVGIDADVDIDGDAVFDAEGGEGVVAAARFLSIRNFIFVTAFFGLTGTLFTIIGIPSTLTLAAAIAMGLVAGLTMHKLMAYLRSSEVGEESGSLSDLEGSPAKVFLDVSKNQRGKISVRKGDRWVTLIATVHEEAAHERYVAGETVTIVSMNDGTAQVAGEHFIQ